VVVSFDHVNHDILVGRIAEVIRDKRVLHLIGKYLRRGAMVDGVVIESEEGTPQGGPLSPLLANIYLDALEQELDRRKHSYSRYADDCNIYVGSQAAAERTLASVQGWIEKHVRLKVKCGPERDREGLGTEVPGISTGSQEADRDSAGEPGKIQGKGTGEVGRSPKSHQQPTTRRMEAVRARLVGVFPTGGSAWPDLRTGGLGAQAHPEVLLVEMARAGRRRTETAESRVERPEPRGGDEWSRRLGSGQAARNTQSAQ